MEEQIDVLNPAEKIIQFIVVKLGGEQYGIDIAYVDNIVRMQQITRVAKSQEYYVGVINLRGEVVPIMSLRRRFDLEDIEYTHATRIIIVRMEDQSRVGFIVDEVREVVDIEEGTIEVPNFKLDEKKAENKIKRWQAIAEAAAKQSKRAVIPEFTMPMTMKQAVEMARSMDVKLIPYENAKGIEETKRIIEGIEPGQSIAIFIGPEGGFSEQEIELCQENDIKPITLGKRILRTETAGFTIISWLMYHLEQ